MKRFYLIQRGTWSNAKNLPDFNPDILYGGDGLFTIDYMGAAEFE